MVELEVLGVRVARGMAAPVLLLKERRGPRILPIWIGLDEADAIVGALEECSTVSTTDHRQLVESFREKGAHVDSAVITDVDEGIYRAHLVLDGVEMGVRSSDAIAVALWTHAPVLCDPEVLDEAGVMLAGERQNVVEAFHAFLDTVDPEDFRTLK